MVNKRILNKNNCECCSPLGCSALCEADYLVNNTTMFAYLDHVPRAQWCAADVLLYVNFPIGRDRSKEVAKAWLRRAIVKAPPRYACSAQSYPRLRPWDWAAV